MTDINTTRYLDVWGVKMAIMTQVESAEDYHLKGLFVEHVKEGYTILM
ncbi:Uncharacterised protein [Budvicia aquatica]|uniref:Uncharacterized protein n=1 Tax=Budvicia aquatica TaxID=82979 RepID=A0A484ZHF4_9GAMM|nr:hypothetical protein [Budvicia aquatica]VFS46873.1 Uncharacterised protein [Budvicia aquatica]